MNAENTESIEIRCENDVVICRQRVRIWATRLKFGLVDQTKLVTAASEIARNTLIYGGGGMATIISLQHGAKIGLRLVFEDKGKGIQDIEQAMRDGYTSGTGLGLGLSGAKRLSHEFEITSQVDEGTRVVLIRWK